mgnify:CR=1 FL=1
MSHQANRTTTPRTRPTEAAPANRPTMSQSSFRQLEQDRMARFSERAGTGNRPAFGSGGGGAPAGGRFEGRAAEGGRFHR